MASDEVCGELSAELFEGADEVRRQFAEPNPCCALQRRREGPTHDGVRYPLKMH